MKRMTGWILTIAGGAATLWGGVSLLTGSMENRVQITPDFSVNALAGGLVGLAVLTVGLIWVRD